MDKWINVDDIIAEQNKYCFLCEGEEETTHCSVCFAKDVVSAIIYHTQGIDLVRCGECKWSVEDDYIMKCWNIKGLNKTDGIVNADNFCSYGERKEN